MRTMLTNKLKSNKGIFLSMITMPMMVIAIAFGLGIFVRSVNEKNQLNQQYLALQAQYEAFRGIEYAFIEIKNQNYSSRPFLTHTVNSANETNPLVAQTASTLAPIPSINGTSMVSAVYVDYNILDPDSNRGFEVKTYMANGEVYILSQGTYRGKKRLFVNKVAGTSLYNYFAFYPGNTTMGWSTFDAGGGKIQVNQNLLLGEQLTINNVDEINTAGSISFVFYQYVKPGNENNPGSDKENRFPYLYPVGYSAANPPPANNVGVYRNYYDGHYTGDRTDLLMRKGDGTIANWDYNPFTGIASAPPIPVSSLVDATGQRVLGVPDGFPDYTNLVWGNPADSYVYYQSNFNCAAGSCASQAANNSQYYPYTPKINGVYIPSDLGGSATSYEISKYYSDTNPVTKVNVNLTNSEATAESKQLWDNFINSLHPGYAKARGSSDPLNPLYYQITGTAASADGQEGRVVNAGTRNGAQYISPPAINMQQLEDTVRTTQKGMYIIRKEDDYDKIKIVINDDGKIGR